jgi:hypothetical protein
MTINGTDAQITLTKSRKNGFKGTREDFDNEVLGKRNYSPELQQSLDEYRTFDRVEVRSSENEEKLAELHETNCNKVKDKKFPDQELMIRTDVQRQGRKMTHKECLKTLRKKLKCWYNPVPWEGIVGLRAIRRGYEQKGIQYVCGVQLGRTTEFDRFHYDQHGVELNKKNIGWRSVLLTLISKGFLTEEEAHELFGRPIQNDASLIYRRHLWNIRNNRGEIAKD